MANSKKPSNNRRRSRPPNIASDLSNLHGDALGLQPPGSASAGNNAPPGTSPTANHSEDATETLTSPTHHRPPLRGEEVTFSAIASPRATSPRPAGPGRQHGRHAAQATLRSPNVPYSPTTLAASNQEANDREAALARAKQQFDERDQKDYDRILKLEQENDALQQKLAQLEQEKKDLQGQVKVRDETIREHEPEIKELESQVEAEKNNNEPLRGEILKLKYDMDDMKQEVESYASDLRDEQEAHNKLKEERDALAAENEGYDATLEEYQAEIEELRGPAQTGEENKAAVDKIMQAFNETFTNLSAGVSMDEYIKEMREAVNSSRLRRDTSQHSLADSDFGEPYPRGTRPGAGRDRQVSSASIGDELMGLSEGEDDDEEGGEEEIKDPDRTLTDKELFEELFGPDPINDAGTQTDLTGDDIDQQARDLADEQRERSKAENLRKIALQDGKDRRAEKDAVIMENYGLEKQINELKAASKSTNKLEDLQRELDKAMKRVAALELHKRDHRAADELIRHLQGVVIPQLQQQLASLPQRPPMVDQDTQTDEILPKVLPPVVIERTPWWFRPLIVLLGAIYCGLLGDLIYDRSIWYAANDTTHLERMRYTGGPHEGLGLQMLLLGWFGGDMSMMG